MQSFFDFHVPVIKPKSSYYEKDSRLVLVLFQGSVGRLTNVRLAIRISSCTPTEIRLAQGFVEDKQLRKNDRGFNVLSFDVEEKGRVLTRPVNIKRRSYMYLSLKLPQHSNLDQGFTIQFVRSGRVLAEFKQTTKFEQGVKLII